MDIDQPDSVDADLTKWLCHLCEWSNKDGEKLQHHYLSKHAGLLKMTIDRKQIPTVKFTGPYFKVAEVVMGLVRGFTTPHTIPALPILSDIRIVKFSGNNRKPLASMKKIYTFFRDTCHFNLEVLKQEIGEKSECSFVEHLQKAGVVGNFVLD